MYGYFDNGKIIAITGIIHQRKAKKMIFKNHYVLPANRGEGIFKDLFHFSMITAVSRGVEVVEATCTPMSISHYRKNGFVVVGEYKNGCKKVRNEDIQQAKRI
jgi:N-acetylglutamate synthase-like GNAT family acetyltransferase